MRSVAALLTAAFLLQGCSGDTPAPSPNTPPSLAVHGLRVCCGSDAVDIGLPRQLEIIAMLADGTEQDVTAKVTSWESSHPSIATISSTGRITAVAPGKFRVSATYAGLQTGWDMYVTPPSIYRPPEANEVTGYVREMTVLGAHAILRAQVEVSGGPANGRIVETKTGGIFRIDGLDRADFDLIVRARGYSPARVHVTELGRELNVTVSAAPGVVSDVLEGDVCWPIRTITRAFTPKTAGFLRITGVSLSTTRQLLAGGTVVRSFIPYDDDVELNAGTRYELRVTGACEYNPASQRVRVTWLHPVE